MKIKFKIILFFLIIGFVPILFYTFFGLKLRYKNHFNQKYEFYIGQLFQINFNINTLFSAVEFDIQNIINNKVVQERDDRDFTNFLNADEKTFKYKISAKEQAIIDIFYLYLITHPYVNSVYMGRENGSFVRSHPRPRPTKYDPRERPWYQVAKNNPNKIIRTKPYKSVTSEDINIGIVKALVDENNNFYGVVGIDITLDKLTNFVSNISLLKGEYILLIDNERNILVHSDKSMLFKKIESLKIKNIDLIYKTKQGYIKFKEKNNNNYLFFYTDENTNWKVCAVVPEKIIISEFYNIVKLIIIGLIFIILIVTFISIFIAGNLLSPVDMLLKEMSGLVDRIKNHIPFEKINIKTGDEMEKLSDAFNAMAFELESAYNKLNDNYRRIKELDKLKSAFISMVSHELKIPITIIKGSLAVLKMNKDTQFDKKVTELLELIQNNINRLQSIIDDLLDLSKIETGVFPVKKTKANITEVLEKSIEELLPYVAGRNIRIIKRYDDTAIEWDFDSWRIARVFNNVLNNAIKFSHDNSEIVVEMKVIGGNEVKIPIYLESIIYLKKKYLLISFSDKGIGIEKQYHEKIFEKLFQVEDPLTRKYPGAGIGLSIAKVIVEQHGGYIWCESEGIGKGATFYVLLPE